MLKDRRRQRNYDGGVRISCVWVANPVAPFEDHIDIAATPGKVLREVVSVCTAGL